MLLTIDSYGEVEGRDNTDSADGVPLLDHEVAGTLTGDDLAVDGATETESIVANIDVLLNLALALGQDLAHLERDQGTERLELLVQGITHLADNLATLGGGGLAPHDLDVLHLLQGLVELLDSTLCKSKVRNIDQSWRPDFEDKCWDDDRQLYGICKVKLVLTVWTRPMTVPSAGLRDSTQGPEPPQEPL